MGVTLYVCKLLVKLNTANMQSMHTANRWNAIPLEIQMEITYG